MKVPKAVQEPTGKWYIRLRIQDENGKTVSYSIREDTPEKAQARALAIKSGLTKPKQTDKALTLGRAIDKYIADCEPVRSPSTIAGYKSMRRTRFTKYMNTPAELIDWQKAVNEETRACSEKTLKNAFSLAKAALDGYGVSIKAKLPTVVPNEHAYLSPDEMVTFIEAVRGQSFEIPALLAMHGLRRSEIYALTWKDIDLKEKTISVRGALVIDDDGNKVLKKQTKTKTSRRKIGILIDELYRALLQVKHKSGMVCAGHPNSLYKQINTLCAQNDLPLVGVHGMRHSYVSLCFCLGIQPLVTMESGGWSDLSVMENNYTHFRSEYTRDKLAKVSSFFQNAKSKCQVEEKT